MQHLLHINNIDSAPSKPVADVFSKLLDEYTVFIN